MKSIINKSILLIFFFLVTSYNVAQAFSGPDTFADLAEKVSPSVVNISTTGVIEQSSPQIPSIEDFFNFPFNMPSPCLLYTSPSPRDLSTSRMPSSA